jgi:hypothetical protein
MRASRKSCTGGKPDFRPTLIAKALERSSFLLGRVGGKNEPIRGLVVPRAAALAELNIFLKLPDPITDEELKAVLRANGWQDKQ